MSKTRKSSPERKKEILEVVQKIIYEDGFYNLTIRNIARKLDISEAAIYRHFSDKEDIIDRLTDLVFNQECSFKKINDNNSVKLLKKFIEQQIDKFENNPYLSTISFQDDIFREYPRIKKKFINHQKEREDQIVKMINEGIKEGLIRDDINPKAFASIYMGSIRIAVSKWKNDKFSHPIRKVLFDIKEELFKYVELEEEN
ncbi:MAG: TetR/AcrR family transcriptional regulator [Halanaerobiales bacterium]|nr:TetR/AcrR family transcriptional regulator [Halanaerobiales bacterium]